MEQHSTERNAQQGLREKLNYRPGRRAQRGDSATPVRSPPSA
jgi:hypothetical protein